MHVRNLARMHVAASRDAPPPEFSWSTEDSETEEALDSCCCSHVSVASGRLHRFASRSMPGAWLAAGLAASVAPLRWSSAAAGVRMRPKLGRSRTNIHRLRPELPRIRAKSVRSRDAFGRYWAASSQGRCGQASVDDFCPTSVDTGPDSELGPTSVELGPLVARLRLELGGCRFNSPDPNLAKLDPTSTEFGPVPRKRGMISAQFGPP